MYRNCNHYVKVCMFIAGEGLRNAWYRYGKFVQINFKLNIYENV